MDLHEMSEDVANALVDQLAVIDKRQAEQRARWYRVEDGKHVEIRQVYSVAGHERELSTVGIEKPSRLDIKAIKAEVNSDLSLKKNKGVLRLLARMFTGSPDKTAEVKITVELEKGEPSEGLMALHKRAANEIKDFVDSIDIKVDDSDNKNKEK